jgi:hypothetical protein
MRRVLPMLLVGLVVVLASCSLVVSAVQPQFPKGTTGTLEAGVWTVRADSSVRGFVIGSAAEITLESSTAPCRFQPVAAGERQALACNAPNTVRFRTPAAPFLRILPDPPVTLYAFQLGPLIWSRG